MNDNKRHGADASCLFLYKKINEKTGVMDMKKTAKAITSKENNMEKIEGG
ncbi:hypothetical protein P4T89_05205 [Bacillus nakamurai]|nr:hypothetical protein [Bacillus nakamurai]MED1227017.1 hypothetical protein [Bacillus nakamurai]